MKITRNDAEYVSKLHIKFSLKILKNKFLMNTYFSGAWFFIVFYQLNKL